MHIIPKVKIKTRISNQVKVVFQQSTMPYSLIGGYRRYLQKCHYKISGLKFKISQTDKISVPGFKFCKCALHGFDTTLHDIFLQNSEGNIRPLDTVIFSGQNSDDTTRTKGLQGRKFVVLLAKCAVLPQQAFQYFFQASTSFLSYIAGIFYSSFIPKLQ